MLFHDERGTGSVRTWVGAAVGLIALACSSSGGDAAPMGGTGGAAGGGGGAGTAGRGGSAGGGLPGLDDCGPAAGDCAEALSIPSQTFFRSYDRVSRQGALDYTEPLNPATVTALRVDRFEVTVGRLRPFVAAWSGGWRPAAGAGKHAHLNGGQGLSTGPGTFEAGWQPEWEALLPATAAAWDLVLAGEVASTGAPPRPTWTPAPGPHERRPANWLAWAAAYAFCIWDGGFLPSEAEWNLAAAGGDEQRAYPWSRPSTDTTVDATHASFACGASSDGCTLEDIAEVGTFPEGAGRWGHADLAGNVAEWTLDGFASGPAYTVVDCRDCTEQPGGNQRSIRGGSSASDAFGLLVARRQGQAGPLNGTGVRCARAP